MSLPALPLSKTELILGGQRSGKSRRAEKLAQQWLEAAPDHEAVFIATATAWDAEMRDRILRHQQDRAELLPRMSTFEEPVNVGSAVTACSKPQTMIVIDCLTLWLTNLLMPPEASDKAAGWGDHDDPRFAPDQKSKDAVHEKALVQTQWLLQALKDATGPILLVSNEIGLGVIPMGRETRDFVDALGRLNQEVAAACERVTLMAAGLPLTIKEPA